jgi:hypothetical protein
MRCLLGHMVKVKSLGVGQATKIAATEGDSSQRRPGLLS